MSLTITPSSVKAGTLCDDCRKIDFTEALDTPLSCLRSGLGILVAKITRFSDSCDLCNEFLYQKTFFEIASGTNSGHCFELRALPVTEYKSLDQWIFFDAVGTIRISIVPQSSETRYSKRPRKEGERYTFVRFTSAPNKVLHPLTLHPRFDVDRIRTWMDVCKETHADCCEPAAFLPDLRLIDSTTNKLQIFPHSPPPYVALSYVWGKQTPTTSAISVGAIESSLPSPDLLSRSIKDAISVTKALGFQYLWVDKYCIDQADEKKRKHQIDNMDRIYNGAELTIIAASGEDEHHELPGVNSERLQPFQFTTGDFTVFREPLPALVATDLSRWATRGWTFQEECLSRRRLFFLPEQVYFGCLKMECYESQGGAEVCPSNSRTMHSLLTQREKLHTGLYPESSRSTLGATEYRLNIFADLVQGYSSRELTFDDDALKAFAGVQRVLEMGPNPIGNTCGLPIPLMESPDLKELEAAIAFSLSWESCTPEKPRRRDSFPTWSWAGWTGHISMPRSQGEFGCQFYVSDIKFRYEDGYMAPLVEVSQSQFAALQIQSNNRKTQHLHSQISYNETTPTRDWSLPKSIIFLARQMNIDRLNLLKDGRAFNRWSIQTSVKSVRLMGSRPVPTLPFSAYSDGIKNGTIACFPLHMRKKELRYGAKACKLHILLVEWTQPGEARRIGKLTAVGGFQGMGLYLLTEEYLNSLPLVQVKLS